MGGDAQVAMTFAQAVAARPVLRGAVVPATILQRLIND
jgi:hypothetical protein